MKTSAHPALPQPHESFAAVSLFRVVDPSDNQAVICQGATRKKTKRELESKVRQQMSAMKVLQSEKEAASMKLDVLGQKYKKVSASLQSARASVREVNSKKREVEASLKSSIENGQYTLQSTGKEHSSNRPLGETK